jgi:hypothetical protein
MKICPVLSSPKHQEAKHGGVRLSQKSESEDCMCLGLVPETRAQTLCGVSKIDIEALYIVSQAQSKDKVLLLSLCPFSTNYFSVELRNHDAYGL